MNDGRKSPTTPRKRQQHPKKTNDAPKKPMIAKKNQPRSNATTMMGSGGEGDKWRAAMAQTMRVASSGPFGMFFFKFYSSIYFLTKSFFQVITTTTTTNDKHGLGNVVYRGDDEMGPNDARCVVWALCELFIIFSSYLIGNK